MRRTAQRRSRTRKNTVTKEPAMQGSAQRSTSGKRAATALSAGFDDHFTKPVDPERLLQLILAPSRSDVPTRTGRND